MVMRRNTVHPLDQLRGEVDRLFNGFVATPAGATAARLVGRPFPAVNVWEHGDDLYAEAEVPGLKSENVEISVVGNELTIKGERPETEQDSTAFHRRERGAGPFTRILRLPVEINADKVQAALKDGVLLITLPKSEAAKPRKIQVNTRE